MKNKKYFAFVCLLFWLAEHSYAYDLVNACKATSSWAPILGTCDANGRLQGQGIAKLGKYSAIVVRGSFLNGLPTGAHELQFLPVTHPLFKSIRPELLNQTFERADNICNLNFENGLIANADITCDKTVGPPSKRRSLLKFSLTPFDGKVRIDLSNPNYPAIVADIPDVVLTSTGGDRIGSEGGYISNSLFPEVKNITAKGKADTVRIGMNQMLSKFEVVISNALMTMSDKSRASELSGMFNITCMQLACTMRNSLFHESKDFKGFGSALDVNYLSTLRIGSKKYQFVVFNDNLRQFYYFKSPEGLEFDGSVSECGGKGIANAIDSSRTWTDWNSLDIKPECGKITTPDGKVYSGKFDRDGRPTGS